MLARSISPDLWDVVGRLLETEVFFRNRKPDSPVCVPQLIGVRSVPSFQETSRQRHGTAAKNCLLVKRLDEESESTGLPDGSLGGTILMASNKDNTGLG